VERKCTTSPNPFSLQGEGEPEFFLVPLSFARRGARGEVFSPFHITSVNKRKRRNAPLSFT